MLGVTFKTKLMKYISESLQKSRLPKEVSMSLVVLSSVKKAMSVIHSKNYWYELSCIALCFCYVSYLCIFVLICVQW